MNQVTNSLLWDSTFYEVHVVDTEQSGDWQELEWGEYKVVKECRIPALQNQTISEDQFHSCVNITRYQTANLKIVNMVNTSWYMF